MLQMSFTAYPSARRRAGAFAAALRAFALLAVLLFSAGVQADPVELERIMQTVRSERLGLGTNLQDAYQHLDAGQAAEAQASLALVRANTTALSLALAELDAQMRQSMALGQYTDKRALAIAIVEGGYAKSEIDFIDGYVANMQSLPTAFARALIDAGLPWFDKRVEKLEASLALSQA